MQHHSTVGLVTNSSSETFTMTQAKIEEILFDHLQAVLGEVGSDAEAREVFEIVIEPSEDYLERKTWDFQDSDLFTDELENEIKAYENKDYVSDNVENWPADARALFFKWLSDNGGFGVSLRVSNEDSYYGRGPVPQGAVFIRLKATGAVSTKLSANAMSILDLRKNGESDY